MKKIGELYNYLYLKMETEYMTLLVGADYWDADRRHHKISQEVLFLSIGS